MHFYPPICATFLGLFANSLLRLLELKQSGYKGMQRIQMLDDRVQ